MRMMLLALAVCLTISTVGCNTVRLHPVTDKDLKVGDWCKPGWVCMSQDYVKYVMKVRIEEKMK